MLSVGLGGPFAKDRAEMRANTTKESRKKGYALPFALPLGMRWTPKVGQVGSLTQTQTNDPHVQETTSA